VALADRGDAAAVAAATGLLKASGDTAVRLAAIRLVGRLGGEADVPTLVTALAGDGPMPAAARRALVELSGSGAAAAIRVAAGSGAASSRAALLDLLAERRDRAALPTLVAAAGDGDALVRQAAIRGLAAFGGPGEIPALVALIETSSGEERKAVELAIVRVCTANRDAAAAATVLLSTYESETEPTGRSLLPALARIGGPAVMAIIDSMLADPARRPQGLDALSKWPDATIKDRLLELLGATTSELLEVAQLPLKSGQLFQTREGQDMPGGSEGEEGREELARLWGHALKNVPTESTPHFVQLLDRRDRPGGHPHQCKYIEILAGLSAFLIAYPDFEQVARVLPVERRNLLAGIDLRGGEGGRHQSKQELHSSLIVAGQHGGSTNVEPSSMVPTQRELLPVGSELCRRSASTSTLPTRSPHCRNIRTAFTLKHRDRSCPRTDVRSPVVASNRCIASSMS
jgi:HEAT repeat protein